MNQECDNMELANETFYIYETCPHCDNVNEVGWWYPAMGFVSTCKYCGKELVLCTACFEVQKDCDNHKCNNELCRIRRKGGL